MRPETENIIKEKFRRSLSAHKDRHKENLKNLFEIFEISFNLDTLIAYFMGVLRAISFDSVAFIEAKGLKWSELEKLEKELKDEIINVAKEILSDK